MAWTNQIEHIRNGESVSAGVASRPDRQIASRTEQLRAQIDDLQAGDSIADTSAVLESSLSVGQPVFFNTSTQRYEKALAATVESSSGVLSVAESAQVVGVVSSKTSSTAGTVLLLGVQTLSISAAVSGSVTAGWYYLSSSTAGKLTKQQPAISIPVLLVYGDGRVFVNPRPTDYLTQHQHYSFELKSRPSGTNVVEEDGTQSIADADDSIEGWLPAADTSFGGNAPTGAKFGYNIAANASLRSVWPPVPLSAAQLVWDRGETLAGGSYVPLGSSGRCILDRFGIWWMTDCAGEVPWPLTYGETSSSSSSSSSGAGCSVSETMQMTLSFARVLFATAASVVSSLTVADGSGLTIRNQDGASADTGDLVIDSDDVTTASIFSAQSAMPAQDYSSAFDVPFTVLETKLQFRENFAGVNAVTLGSGGYMAGVVSVPADYFVSKASLALTIGLPSLVKVAALRLSVTRLKGNSALFRQPEMTFQVDEPLRVDGAVAYNLNHVEFPVTPGDLLLVRLSRAEDTGVDLPILSTRFRLE